MRESRGDLLQDAKGMEKAQRKVFSQFSSKKGFLKISGAFALAGGLEREVARVEECDYRYPKSIE